MRDFAPMTGSLELATAFRPLTDKAAAKVVWHCPLRTAPGDRRLSDAEWAEVARDVMHRTGIAERGDDGGCRWVAVRHDDVSVHLVAVLARQDGEAARIGNDYRHLRSACRAAEQRLGLARTGPADLTADRHTTRAEVEKAARTGVVPDRDWLREQVQVLALVSTDPREFLARLRRVGLVVRERTDKDGALTGYAVGRQARPGETGVLFGGGKLAPDLSLPRLQARWQTVQSAVAEDPEPVAQPQQVRGTGVAAALATSYPSDPEPARRLAAAGRACQQATELLREAVGDPARRHGDATADLVEASSGCSVRSVC